MNASGKPLVISTGIYSSYMAYLALLKETGHDCVSGHENEFVEADVILYSKYLTDDFKTANETFLKKNGYRGEVFYLNDYLKDGTFNKRRFAEDIPHFTKLFTPQIAHPALRHVTEFFESTGGVALVYYEEGLGSYENRFTESDLTRFLRLYLHFPLGLNQQWFKQHVLNVTPLEPELFKKYRRKVLVDTKIPFSKKHVLILGSSLHLYNFLNTEEEFKIYRSVINDLLNAGYVPVFKDHPRSQGFFERKITECFGDDVKIISERYEPVEFLRGIEHIAAVIGALSSSLFNFSHFFDTPAFVIREVKNYLKFSSHEYHIFCKTARFFHDYKKFCKVDEKQEKNEKKMREISDNLKGDKKEHIKVIKDTSLVSIIVPVYNVEKYLAECLTSLMRQTYVHTEVIIVNDGSTDRSVEIAEDYVRKYANFKIISQKNGGLSAARNAGKAEALGKYICFVDSDDFLEYTAVEKLVNAAQGSGCEVVRCLHYTYEESADGRWFRTQPVRNPQRFPDFADKVLSYQDHYRILTDLPISACTGMYENTPFFKSIRFPVGKYYEDNYFFWKIVSTGRKLLFLDSCLYYYRSRFDSITKTDGKNDIDNLYVHKMIYDDICKAHREDLFEIFYNRLERVICIHLKKTSKTPYYTAFARESVKIFNATHHDKLRRKDYFKKHEYFLLKKKRFYVLRTFFLLRDFFDKIKKKIKKSLLIRRIMKYLLRYNFAAKVLRKLYKIYSAKFFS